MSIVIVSLILSYIPYEQVPAYGVKPFQEWLMIMCRLDDVTRTMATEPGYLPPPPHTQLIACIYVYT